MTKFEEENNKDNEETLDFLIEDGRKVRLLLWFARDQAELKLE